MFDELHAAVDGALASGRISVDDRRELRSVLAAFFRCATIPGGPLWLAHCSARSLQQALDFKIAHRVFAEMAKTRTDPMILTHAGRSHPRPGQVHPPEIQGIADVQVPWPIKVAEADRAPADATASPSVEDDRRAVQELRARLEELSAVASMVAPEAQQQVFDFLQAAGRAIEAGWTRLDFSASDPFTLEVLAGAGFFGILGDFAQAVGRGPVEVRLPPGIGAAPAGLRQDAGKFFLA